jgi:tagatose-1,6-bisphosphate aldolase
MKTITIGKYRGLQQCATPRGAISILALDHRNNLRNALRPDDPKSVTDQDMIDFKRDVIGLVAPAASAVLLDPEFGIAQSIKSRDLPGQVGLLVTLEETGYTGDTTARSSTVLPKWNPAKARRMGANAIKLLVYYHPDAQTAGKIEQLVGDVAEQCQKQDIPFFLEPLSYSLDPKEKKLTPKDRRRVVIETARKLTPLGADVLKTEFPLDIADEVSEEAWGKACAELSAASTLPWVLLSASVSYEIYLRQVAVACWKGASGVAVGRAVWQEAVTMSGEVRKHFLQNKVFERMQRVTALCNALARPWTDFYTIAEPTTTWYQDYASDLDR